ncbi:hypothetical protein FRB96_003443 [Tulasnella sp. 330]|nr:hypothetical protein FRB96_003443 [Tulasnella sp. 330]KAG8880958.1 hypothetical protein FRB97_000282 [Tulasnella sp. 331]KAG8888899.1 hypothetical protein FRB98_006441 [Tulasnella sp. 332]
MAIVDFIKDNATKYLPQKKQPGIPMPISTSTGGIGHGIASFEDEMPLSKPAIVFYAMQIFFCFLAMCCFASVASFQASNKIGVSGLSGFALFVSVTGILLSATMLLVPVIYDKYDKLSGLSRAIREDRVHFIMSTFGIIWLLFISFITTISAWTEPGCKDPSKDPHASNGKTYQAELPGWCQTKKAGSVFFWFAFLSWGATFAIILKEWRQGKTRGRPRDPPFANPVEHSHEVSDTSSYYPTRSGPGGAHRALTDVDEDEEPQSPFNDPPRTRYAAGITPSLPPVDTGPRHSVDAYGAFADPAPTGYNDPPVPDGVSRTMQYADPYAAVRANIGPRTGQPPDYDY